MITKYAKLWIGSPQGAPPVIRLSQYDTDWKLVFTLYNGDSSYSLSSGASVVMNGRKPDGRAFSVIGSTEDGNAVVQPPRSVTEASGRVECEIAFSDDGGVTGTANFYFEIERAPLSGFEASEDDFSAVNQLVNKALSAAGSSGSSAASAAASAAAAQVMAATPTVVTSTDDMTDPSKLYVLVDNSENNGCWYYLDGTTPKRGGAYNGVAVNTDSTLTVSGAAADAKAAGDGIRGVKKTLDDLLISTIGNSDIFAKGAITTSGSSGGQDASSNKNIRTKTVLPASTYAVECASGWSAAYYAYDGDTYIGCWGGTEFGTTRVFFNGTKYLKDMSDEYSFRVVIRKNDGSNIDVSAASNITIWSLTDVSLSKDGAIADAKATGHLGNSLGYWAVKIAQPVSDNYVDNSYTRTGYYINGSGIADAAAANGVSNLIPVKAGVTYDYDMSNTGTFGSNGKRVAFYPKTVTEEDDLTADLTVKTATEIIADTLFQFVPSADGFVRINRAAAWTSQWFGVAFALVAATAAAMADTTKAYVYTGSESGYTAGHKYTYDADSSEWVDAGTYVYRTAKASYVPGPASHVDAVLNPLYGKKLACEGASIMAGNESYRGGYAKMVALDNDMEFVNNAVGGGTVATGTTNPHSHWVSASIESLPEGYDYYIFDGAANDIDNHVPFGTPADVDYYGDYNSQTGLRDTAALLASLDRSTFSGAFEYCCIVLATKYGAAKHGYVIPHRKRAGAKQVHSACGGAVDPILGYPTWRTTWLDLWKPFIKATLAKWGIACLDLEEVVPPLGLIDSLKSAYTVDGDGAHPTEDAYRLFYKGAVEAWLRTL